MAGTSATLEAPRTPTAGERPVPPPRAETPQEVAAREVAQQAQSTLGTSSEAAGVSALEQLSTQEQGLGIQNGAKPQLEQTSGAESSAARVSGGLTGDQQAELNAVRAAAEMIREQKRERAEQLKGMTSEQLQEAIEDAAEEVEAVKEMLSIARSKEVQNELLSDWARKRGELNALKREAQSRGKTGQITKESQVAQAENRRRERAMAEEAGTLQGMSLDELRGEAERLGAMSGYFESRLNDERANPESDPDSIKVLGSELSEARAKEQQARRQLGLVQKRDKTRTSRAEAESEEQKTKKEEEERTRWIMEAAPPAELEAWINQSTGELTTLEDRISELRDQTIFGKDKKTAERALAESVSQANETRRNLAAYQEALERARGREAVERGLEDVTGIESIQKLSKADYDNLSAEDQAKYLERVGKALNEAKDDLRYATLKAKVKEGGDMSVRDRAFFAKWLASEVLAKGIKSYGMDNFVRLEHQYPDITKLMFDIVAADKAARERYDQLPEALKKGKGGKNLLWILLMILGSAVAATFSGANLKEALRTE
jgi:hypothetical protein